MTLGSVSVYTGSEDAGLHLLQEYLHRNVSQAVFATHETINMSEMVNGEDFTIALGMNCYR